MGPIALNEVIPSVTPSLFVDNKTTMSENYPQDTSTPTVSDVPTILLVDVNDPEASQSVPSTPSPPSTGKKSKRSRRRRNKPKGSGRRNKVEPVSHSQSLQSSGSRLDCHQNKGSSKKDFNNMDYTSQKETQQQQKQRRDGDGSTSSSSSFRSPIVSWRSKNNQRRFGRNNSSNDNNDHDQLHHNHHHPHSNSNSRNLNQNHNYHHQNHNHHHRAISNHYSPRHSLNGSGGGGNLNRLGASVCPASMGFPTSKKQHDAPMKKRDLYFSLHVERVRIQSVEPSSAAEEEAVPLQSFPQNLEGHSQSPPEGGVENTAFKKKIEENPNELFDAHEAVARVTLLNWENEVVLDAFVAVPSPVIDFRGTGIRQEDIVRCSGAVTTAANEASRDDDNHDDVDRAAAVTAALSFSAARTRVEQILKGKILIGYGLDDALQALEMNHPSSDTRDCSKYFSNYCIDGAAPDSSSLDTVGKLILNRSLESARFAVKGGDRSDVFAINQSKDVSKRPVQCCVTSMDLYKKHRKEWEEALMVQARERDRKQKDRLLFLSQQRQQQEQQRRYRERQQHPPVPTVSLHCDMVRTSMSEGAKVLARVTIVDALSRNVLLDEFAQIPVPVIDFCNTGLTTEDVRVVNSSKGNNNNICKTRLPQALPILRTHVERLLRGRLVIGYKVGDDLRALGLSHPWTHIRDVAYFQPFLREKVVGGSTSIVAIRSMDELSEEFLRHRIVPRGDRSRSVDICRSALGLYEAFRDQWERQHQEAYIFRLQQQQHHLHQQQHQGLVMSPSPSASFSSRPALSRHHQNQHYQGQQIGIPLYGASTVSSPPLHQQKPASMPENTGMQQSRPNPSSWFPWGKRQGYDQQQQSYLQNYVANNASVILSPQASQVLQQEESVNHKIPFSAENNALHQDTCSTSSYLSNSLLAVGTFDSRFEGSTTLSNRSGHDSDAFAAMSVVSSLPDEMSSVISSDYALGVSGESPPAPPTSKSGTSSSWFRFGSRKAKYSSTNDKNRNNESMTAVHETEVLTDDMMPTPTILFSSQETDVNSAECKPKNSDEGQQQNFTDPFISSVANSRSWLKFRRLSNSPGRKERSRSPKPSQAKTVEDFAIATQPEVPANAATEASIEITISIPEKSTSCDDLVSPLTQKSVTSSTQPGRPWFGFRRALKSSSSSKNVQSSADASLGKSSTPSETLDRRVLFSPTTEPTTATDDDWFQEIMSQSTGTTSELLPWLNVNDSSKNVEKSSSTSRGQSSWFGFKRSTAKVSNSDKDAWAAMSHNTDSTDSMDLVTLDNGYENTNDIFRARTRLSTASTIPSVVTEEEQLVEEQYSDSETYSKDFENGAAQSLNFLKI